MMVLASCQDVADQTGQSGTATAQSGYPSLHTVPPRPQLSYTIEQRRAIVDGLIADRANARYSSEVVRYRTGLSGLPPPDTPPVVAAPPEGAPLEAAPSVSAAGDAPAPPAAVRDRPVVDPETEFVYEDDDLESFMDEMVGDQVEQPADVAPDSIGPESNAAPLGSNIIRASAARPVGSEAAYAGRPPGVVWAIPAETASLPQTPGATATPATAAGQTPSPLGPVAAIRTGRSPGVVWGKPGMADKPAGPIAVATATRAVDVSAAARSVPRTPRAPAPVGTTDQGGEPTELALAGRAPGVVWGRPDMPEGPARRPDTAPATPAADRDVAPAIETTPAVRQRVEPIETTVADRPSAHPPFEPDADAAGIEIADGLIAIAVVPSDAGDRALETIAFAPGSATLPPDTSARLAPFLAAAQVPDVRVRIVGEGDAPALALDRALAVGLALVQGGVPADRLELTLAPDAVGDQARLFLAASAP